MARQAKDSNKVLYKIKVWCQVDDGNNMSVCLMTIGRERSSCIVGSKIVVSAESHVWKIQNSTSSQE